MRNQLEPENCEVLIQHSNRPIKSNFWIVDIQHIFITLNCSIIHVCFYTKTPDTDFGVNSQKHGQSKIKSTTLEQGRQITLQNPILCHKSNATCRMTDMLLTSLWKSFGFVFLPQEEKKYQCIQACQTSLNVKIF